MEMTLGYGTEIEIRSACLRAYEDGWAPPTGEEVAAVLDLARLTLSEAADLIGVSDRRVKLWTAGTLVPYAVWVLLCEKAGFGVLWDKPASSTH